MATTGTARRRRRHRTRRKPRPGSVRLRPLGPGEDWVVREVFAGLSPESRLRRFHAPVPRLSPTMVARLADVDGRRHLAVAAEELGGDGWRPIGVARLVGTAPGQAELAISVVDARQGQGVGRRLLEDLRHRAAALGIVEITGSILVGNEPMLAVLRTVFPDALLVRDERTWEVRAPVPTARVRTAHPRPARPWRRSRQRRRGSGPRPPMAGPPRAAMVDPPSNTRPSNTRERRKDQR